MIFRSFTQDEKGHTAVEFALLAPFLIYFLMGMIDYGMYVHQRMQLENLARAAAEYVVKGGDENNVMQDVVVLSGKIPQDEMDDVTSESEETCECGTGEATDCGTACPNGGYQRRFYSFSMSKSYNVMFSYPGIDDSLTMTGNARLQIQ